ncbi:hypothetical protein PsorP6_006851 [Peronosclerospora sorghi]|uniref:Uncharacterized protein n=1 Tax=Peronosclerospora sorghi TaxID=230839 RepID=A0ACC0W9W9_9STRA|nr:hypothetical protein PsorP6_006851 [Peronosclerospora sorghi]
MSSDVERLFSRAGLVFSCLRRAMSPTALRNREAKATESYSRKTTLQQIWRSNQYDIVFFKNLLMWKYVHTNGMVIHITIASLTEKDSNGIQLATGTSLSQIERLARITEKQKDVVAVSSTTLGREGPKEATLESPKNADIRCQYERYHQSCGLKAPMFMDAPTIVILDDIET